jgi:hypothetical protein
MKLKKTVGFIVMLLLCHVSFHSLAEEPLSSVYIGVVNMKDVIHDIDSAAHCSYFVAGNKTVFFINEKGSFINLNGKTVNLKSIKQPYPAAEESVSYSNTDHTITVTVTTGKCTVCREIYPNNNVDIKVIKNGKTQASIKAIVSCAA